MNDDTLNMESGLFEELLLELESEEVASLITSSLVVVAGVDVVIVGMEEGEAETEDRLVFDERVLGLGGTNTTYRSALLNGIGLLDEAVAGMDDDEGVALAGLADEEDAGLAARGVPFV